MIGTLLIYAGGIGTAAAIKLVGGIFKYIRDEKLEKIAEEKRVAKARELLKVFIDYLESHGIEYNVCCKWDWSVMIEEKPYGGYSVQLSTAIKSESKALLFTKILKRKAELIEKSEEVLRPTDSRGKYNIHYVTITLKSHLFEGENSNYYTTEEYFGLKEL